MHLTNFLDFASLLYKPIHLCLKFFSAASPARPVTGTPTTPSGQLGASKVTPSSPALASILSRVDITPEGILNALSKANTPGETHIRYTLLTFLMKNATNLNNFVSWCRLVLSPAKCDKHLLCFSHTNLSRIISSQNPAQSHQPKNKTHCG